MRKSDSLPQRGDPDGLNKDLDLIEVSIAVLVIVKHAEHPHCLDYGLSICFIEELDTLPLAAHM